MAMTRTTLLTTSALATFLALGNAARANIVVGVAGPFSGPNASLGEQLKRGVQRAIDDINATGGLRGERLVIETADDGCDPKKAIEAATQFVSAGVKFVAGHYCSGAAIPAAKIYEAAGIVEISPAATNPKFTDEGGWNVIRIAPRDDAQGTIAGRLIAERFAGKTVALLGDQSPAATALVTKAREALAVAGVTPVLDEVYKPGAKQYPDLVERLRNAAADIVYLGGTYVEGGIIIRDLRDLGSSTRLMSGDSLVTEDFWNIAKDAGEGTLMTFMYDPQKFETARPVIARFKDDGYNPEGYTLYSYAAVQAWVQAAEATGGTDGHRIADWLRAGNRIRTVVGELSFDAKGDLKEPRFAWFRWSEGRYAEIDPATLEPPEPTTTP